LQTRETIEISTSGIGIVQVISIS